MQSIEWARVVGLVSGLCLSACGGKTAGSDAPLESVQDAREALVQAAFPGAWEACSSSNLCSQDAPALFFDTGATHVSCGQLYESGFRAATTYPIDVVEEPVGSRQFFIRAAGGPSVPPLRYARGAKGGAVGLALTTTTNDMPGPRYEFRPAAPLP